MAQSSISSFFAVRRKRSSTDGHGTAKRRKLENGTKQVSRLSPPSYSPHQGTSRLSHKMPAYNYKKFQSLSTSSTFSDSSFTATSSNKSKSLSAPAHQQFGSLTKPSPSLRLLDSKPNLPLPFNYKLLVEKFRCVDTIVSMKQKRKEKCTFDKLKEAVQGMTRRLENSFYSKGQHVCLIKFGMKEL